MRILLGSGGFRTPERVALVRDLMRQFFGPARSLLFIPYAVQDHERYVEGLTQRGLNAGYELDGIHRHVNPHRAVADAEAIFVGGGNTFRLLNELYRRDLLDGIRARVRAGLPYFGVSAGSNVACPTIMTTNDMPIVQPPSFAALGLVPFQVNPHYFSGQTQVKGEGGFIEHFGETRDERIREFHEMNDTPVIGLWEGGLLRIENDRAELHGAAARLFWKRREPIDFPAGSELSSVLGYQSG